MGEGRDGRLHETLLLMRPRRRWMRGTCKRQSASLRSQNPLRRDHDHAHCEHITAINQRRRSVFRAHQRAGGHQGGNGKDDHDGRTQRRHRGGGSDDPSHQKRCRGSAGSGPEPALFRAFGLSGGGYFKNLAKPQQKAEIPPSPCGGEEDKPAELSDLLDEIEDGVTDEACESAATRLHEMYEELAKKEAAANKPGQCQGILLPFDFGFTLDGISGFRWGTGISSTRIPQALKDALVWQITAAEHTVTANDWVTTITTVATNRPK